MKAMILAAGLGTRMRPLTDSVPKPLLEAGGKSLLRHQVEALVRAGMDELVINHSRLGERIEAAFGDGAGFGARIRYSPEGEAPLGTAAGIRRALPLLGPDPFLVVNGDVWSRFDYAGLPGSPGGPAHLVLVDNPGHHPAGDFSLEDGRVGQGSEYTLTYSGMAVFQPSLFDDPAGAAHLGPLLREAIGGGRVTGEYYGGPWIDVGTPARLAELKTLLGD